MDVELRWEMFLRGGVAALLVFHLCHLALPGARADARAALALFTLSVLAYVFCQQADVLFSLPRVLGYPLLALCVSSSAWMWIASRALFHDRFKLSAPVVGAALVLAALGLAANMAYLPESAGILPASATAGLSALHGAAMLVFTGAGLWEITRGWSSDLVEPRRAARRWFAMGIGLYAAIALIVELTLRGQPVGRLLPALHVAGIGAVTLALAILVARRSLDEVLGIRPPAAAPVAAPAAPAAPPDVPAEISATAPLSTPSAASDVALADPVSRRPHPGLTRLTQSMTEERVYRHEGLTLTDLAQKLGMGDAGLRGLINQELGYRNFNDFLHHYRLKEAASRLVAEDLPILSIALECGYGSIGPFNRAFRQRFGMTPSEFRGASRLPQQRNGTTTT